MSKVGKEAISMRTGRDLIKEIRAKVKEVDPSEVHGLQSHLQQRNGAEPDLVVVDVREQGEWDQGHIPGAIHVPRSYLESRFENFIPERNKKVVLYCATGQRSALAANTLEEFMGYEDVASMNGGFALWKDRGFPFERPKVLTPEQQERYSRHLLVPEVGSEGQQKLLDAKVLLIGAGGLGSPAALYLAAAGVGTLGIVDDDVVDLTNLQRQVIHNTERIGEPKGEAARVAIEALNPDGEEIGRGSRRGRGEISVGG